MVKVLSMLWCLIHFVSALPDERACDSHGVPGVGLIQASQGIDKATMHDLDSSVLEEMSKSMLGMRNEIRKLKVQMVLMQSRLQNRQPVKPVKGKTPGNAPDFIEQIQNYFDEG